MGRIPEWTKRNNREKKFLKKLKDIGMAEEAYQIHQLRETTIDLSLNNPRRIGRMRASPLSTLHYCICVITIQIRSILVCKINSA